MDSLNLPPELYSRPSSRTASRLGDDVSTHGMATSSDDPTIIYGSPQTIDYGVSSSPRSPGIGRPNIHLGGASEGPAGSGKRSTSTPVFGRRRQAQRDDQAGTSSGSSGHTKKDHQWTVFGQLMENEGQLPPSTSDPSGRRPLLNRASILRSGARNRSPGARNLESGSLFLSTSVQSPAQERRPSFGASILWTPDENRRVEETDYNSDDSDDDGSDVEEAPTPSSEEDESHKTSRVWKWVSSLFPPLSVAYRNMLKCAIAYFVASLFTFEPHLSTLFSGLVSYKNTGEKRLPLPSGHMVATM